MLLRRDEASARAWIDEHGRKVAEELKAKHGLDDDELVDLPHAMVGMRADRHG